MANSPQHTQLGGMGQEEGKSSGPGALALFNGCGVLFFVKQVIYFEGHQFSATEFLVVLYQSKLGG